MSKKENRYLGKTESERRQLLDYCGKQIKKYDDLLNQDEELINWVYELDKLYWRTQVCEKKNVERGKNANERKNSSLRNL
tara:strand:+ start:136 stop:375 length:240 start_codon:yes stop_codon:yes gene_type:complete